MNQSDVIFTYTRSEAIADGEQVCISDLYKSDCRVFKYPVYFTSKVMSLLENSHDPGAVVWDICFMATKSTSRLKLSPSTIKFSVIIENDRGGRDLKTELESFESPILSNKVPFHGCFRRERISNRGVAKIQPDFIEDGCPCYTLVCQVGAKDFDDPSPAVTIMFPDEM